MAKLKPHPALSYIRPDEVAECWNGVGGLYGPLWACVPRYDNTYRDNIEDIGPADVVGLNSVASFWKWFTDDEQQALNALAEAHEAEEEKFYKMLQADLQDE